MGPSVCACVGVLLQRVLCPEGRILLESVHVPGLNLLTINLWMTYYEDADHAAKSRRSAFFECSTDRSPGNHFFF